MCVLTNKRYKTYRTEFSFCRMRHAPGVGLKDTGAVKFLSVGMALHRLRVLVTFKIPVILIVYHSFSRKKHFDLLTLSRRRRHIKGQNICLQCFLCFIPFALICNVTTFRKNDLLTQPQGPRMCVRAKYLLACYCMLHTL